MTRAELQKENEIIKMMKNLDLTREEAEQLWLDDNSDEMTEEQAELERKAKENGIRHIGESTKERKKSTRERKVDTEKGEILNSVKELFESLGGYENISVKTETEISFSLNGNEYTLKLTKHRPPKK